MQELNYSDLELLMNKIQYYGSEYYVGLNKMASLLKITPDKLKEIIYEFDFVDNYDNFNYGYYVTKNGRTYLFSLKSYEILFDYIFNSIKPNIKRKISERVKDLQHPYFYDEHKIPYLLKDIENFEKLYESLYNEHKNLIKSQTKVKKNLNRQLWLRRYIYVR